MKHLYLAFALFAAFQLEAQSNYEQEIAAHRRHYKEEFTSEPRSPFTAKDTSLLDFFPADPTWKVQATLILTPDATVFDMPTYSGKTAQYRQYAELYFEKGGEKIRLNIYQSIRLLQMPEYKDYLFLPFKDLSNGESTYGGGRYLELSLKDLFETDGHTPMLWLDFNKCFNPYCAYSDGYNCPIPPIANHLNMEIPAGEKLFKGGKK